MIGAWVDNYTPLRPGSHPQRGRIVRATYRAPGSLMGGRLQTLEGVGLGDDLSDIMTSETYDPSTDTYTDVTTSDPNAVVVAQSSNDADWLHLVSNIVSAGGKASGSALTAFSAAKQAEGKTQAQISAMISAAMGQAQTGGLSGTTIGLGIGAIALVILIFVMKGRK